MLKYLQKEKNEEKKCWKKMKILSEACTWNHKIEKDINTVKVASAPQTLCI